MSLFPLGLKGLVAEDGATVTQGRSAGKLQLLLDPSLALGRCWAVLGPPWPRFLPCLEPGSTQICWFQV